MDLKKCVIEGKYKFIFYCKKDEVINQTNCVLLGFKDHLPVLSNAMPETNNSIDLSTKKALKVEVNSQIGVKFINLNGRKLKMMTDSELPLQLRKNPQFIRANPTNGIVGKPVKIKIIGTMPSILCGPAKIIKTPETKHLDKFVFKPNLNKVDNSTSNITDLSWKTMLIKENKLSVLKNTSVGKVVAASTTSGSCVDKINQRSGISNDVTQIKLERLTSEIKTLKTSSGVCDMKALTKLNNQNSCSNLGVVGIKKNDKCVQTDNKTFITECVQTEQTFPPHSGTESQSLFNLDKFDLVDFINSTLNIPEIPEPANRSSNSFAAVPEVCCKNAKTSEVRISSFFNDLRSALQPDDKGNMPIHIGVLTNNLNLVKRNCHVLKALQRSVDLPNHGDLTALQLAVLNDVNPEIVKTLLLNGASLEVADSEGNNVLHLAVEYERKVILEIILKAATQRNFNLDNFNAEGLTPLMICCVNGLHRCAELLLEHNADVNVKDRKSGRTALFHAAENHDLNMVHLLLGYNADTKIKNFFGTSTHDAMYEVDEVPDEIKSAILGKSSKRKISEEPKLIIKIKRKDNSKKPLKTYATYKKIDDFNFLKNVTTADK